MTAPTAATESGDRAEFLARLRTRMRGPAPTNVAHPAPEPTMSAPSVVHLNVDARDLATTFATAAAENATTVHRINGHSLSAALVAQIVDSHAIRGAVVTDEPEAQAAAALLAELGVAVGPPTRDSAAAADLGVTGAAAAIAATGSVVIDSGRPGARLASLLPRVHLCVVRVTALVATPSDVLRHLPDPLPSNLVLVSGPSRTGDIELIITLGVHGPVALHVALLEP